LIFIEVPNQFDNIWFRRDMLLRRVKQRERNIRSIHHLWFFSRRTLRQLLERAGFARIAVNDLYPMPSGGWRLPIARIMRAAGSRWYGGVLIQGSGWKAG
jgi:hypothetical protein